MRTQAETALLSAVRDLLSATMDGWPPPERAALERALVEYEREPTQVQRVLALLKLPPGEGHMGDVEKRIGDLLHVEGILFQAVLVLQSVGYPRASPIDGARWAAEEIERLRAKVAPSAKAPPKGKVASKPAAKAARRKVRA